MFRALFVVVFFVCGVLLYWTPAPQQVMPFLSTIPSASWLVLIVVGIAYAILSPKV